ncbi:hypothetical protein LEN26_010495 [Aphanomyces euteiches]|nr:hypothetical protein LEN26_010495 [Aphanomyces euteiches]
MQSSMDAISQARALGRVEGRAEALEEIASLHAQIAELHGRIEDMTLARERQTKELLSNLYKQLKATFKQYTEPLTPKQVVEICKPCLRCVAEGNFVPMGPTQRENNIPPSTMPEDTQTPDRNHMKDLSSQENKFPQPVQASNVIPVEIHPLEDEAEVFYDQDVTPIEDLPRAPGPSVCVSGSEKIGVGHGAYMVYVIELHDQGKAISIVKRRYKDFVWLWERLSAAYAQACVPSLPPKNSIRNHSRFQPAFTEKRKRVLQRWLQYLHMHFIFGLSSFMQSFLHDPVLPDVPHPAAPSLSIEASLSFRKRTSSHDKRLDQSFKKLQEPIAPMQRQLHTVVKSTESVMKAHTEMNSAIDGMQHHCSALVSFEWNHERQTSPWDAWREIAPSTMRLHQQSSEIWEIFVQEPCSFQVEHILPRFERQVHDLGKDLSPAKLDKMCIESDELQYVRAKTLVASFLHAAEQFHQSHRRMKEEWMELRNQHFPRSVNGKEPSKPRPSSEEGLYSQDDEEDDATEARNLFGDHDAEEARTLFSGGNDESSSSDEDAGPTDWDLYIERARRKQKSKAKALAVQKQAAMTAEEMTRKVKKRPQSLNWPIKRSSNLRLDERVKQQHQQPGANKHRSASIADAAPDEAPQVPGGIRRSASTVEIASSGISFETKIMPTNESANWIEVQTTDGQVYYYHKLTRTTRWSKPDQATIDSMEERLVAQHEATQRRLEERRQWHENHRKHQEEEAKEAETLRQHINIQVTSWAKDKDVVDMLNSLHEIFPFKDMLSCHVQDASTNSAVKKAYMKAVRQLHPDKLLPADFTLEQRMLGQHLFTALTSAYQRYKSTVA